MGVKRIFKFVVEGGKASAGPPIGSALRPLGLNVMEVANSINQVTKEFAGMKVPIEVEVDAEEKKFSIKVDVPTTTALIVRELKLKEESSKKAGQEVGGLSIEQVVKIAKIKRRDLLAKSLKAALKEVLGTCLSMKVNVEGKSPKEVVREVDRGLYDKFLEEPS